MDNIILTIFAIITIIALLVVIYIIIYNKIQKHIIRIQEAEHEIDESLRKRHDLLVKMEQEINSNVCMNQDNFKDFKSDYMSTFDADRKLTKVHDTFQKIRDDYRDDLDTESFRKLCTEIKIIEEKSDAAKSYYNKYTTSLNMLIKKFPSNLISRIHKIEERMYFDNKNMNDSNILDFKL